MESQVFPASSIVSTTGTSPTSSGVSFFQRMRRSRSTPDLVGSDSTRPVQSSATPTRPQTATRAADTFASAPSPSLPPPLAATSTAAQAPSREANKLRRMLSLHRLARVEKQEKSVGVVLDLGDKKRSSTDQSPTTSRHSNLNGMPPPARPPKKSLRSVKSIFFDREHAKISKSGVSASSSKTLFRASNDSTNSTRPSASGVRKKKSSESERFITIKPRLTGVFTPSLPLEIWLLILRYATYPPFISPPVSSSSSAAQVAASQRHPYPYPYQTPSALPSCAHISTDPISFLAHAPPHTHLAERLAEYTALVQWKASLTRVCRVWHWIAQELLYEFIWIARGREARVLAGRLCGDGGMGLIEGVRVTASARSATIKQEQKGLDLVGKVKRFGKRGQEPVPPLPGSSSVLGVKSGRPSFGYSSTSLNVGKFIRRIHIETPSMERCSPHDLLLILQYCPQLEVYSDYRSVRRPMHPLALSVSPVVPFSSSSPSSPTYASSASSGSGYQDLLTPDALLHTLLSRPLKKLSWTNYEYDGSDFAQGVRFYEDVVGPRLASVGGELEFLEISLSGVGVYGMGGREDGLWGVGGSTAAGPGNEDRRRRRDHGTNGALGLSAPLVDMPGASSLLTELTVDYTTTTTFSSASVSASSSSSSPLEPSIDGFVYSLLLPALRSLKVTLDNATFFVLSCWDMPLLTHLSVMSADFGYAGGGFRRFFEVHGCKLDQLELGHSSGDIEEAWLTEPSTQPAPLGTVASPADAPFKIPLNAWCPNLKEFICSADAEWNWQSPDWIAPHVLLPAHEGLQFIGVRDMERRLVGDADDAARRRRENQGLAQGHGVGAEEDPYFMLLEQFGSLLRREAFPSLRFVRDMSWESDVIRRTGRMCPLLLASADPSNVQPIPRWLPTTPTTSSPSYSSAFYSSASSAGPNTSSGASSSKKLMSRAAQAARNAEEALARAQGQRVLRFWAAVLERCRERGVWIEDCRGVNVTLADLRRAAA